jgi:hypothetical protein
MTALAMINVAWEPAFFDSNPMQSPSTRGTLLNIKNHSSTAAPQHLADIADLSAAFSVEDGPLGNDNRLIADLQLINPEHPVLEHAEDFGSSEG